MWAAGFVTGAGKPEEVLEALTPDSAVRKALSKGSKSNPDLLKTFVNGLKEVYGARREQFSHQDVLMLLNILNQCLFCESAVADLSEGYPTPAQQAILDTIVSLPPFSDFPMWEQYFDQILLLLPQEESDGVSSWLHPCCGGTTFLICMS